MDTCILANQARVFHVGEGSKLAAWVRGNRRERLAGFHASYDAEDLLRFVEAVDVPLTNDPLNKGRP